MDLDAVLARKPEVALVDELAHTNIPGSRNAKRWQDVEELLAAGINVISTVNIQHLGPEDADVDVDVGDGFCLALRGHPLPADERLGAVAAQAAVTVEQYRLAEAAAAAKPFAEADKMRAALLATAGHDLRTPLAAAKAAVGDLRASDATWKPERVRELAADAYASLDQLTRLVDNLLDLSRLQAGELPLRSGPTDVADVVAHALASLGPSAAKIRVMIPAATPPAVADPALLERVLVNLLSNAIRYSPADSPATVTASALGDRVELRIIDQGPGVSQTDRDRIFAPFRRQAGESTPPGTGLGLALSRGLTEAIGNTHAGRHPRRWAHHDRVAARGGLSTCTGRSGCAVPGLVPRSS